MSTTQPTLEQLLAPIRERAENAIHGEWYGPAAVADRETILAALDAVVAVHSPRTAWWCSHCEGGTNCPCPTIQAAQSALAKGGE